MRLFDADAIKLGHVPHDMSGYTDLGAVEDYIDSIPEIDPKTLPIVQELTEKLKKANKTAENWEYCLTKEIEKRRAIEQKLSMYEQAEGEGRLVELPRLCEVQQ